MANYKAQITDGNVVTPIAIDTTKSRSKITMGNICNNHSLTVDIYVYLFAARDESFILKSVDVPTKSSLVIDHPIEFNNGTVGLKVHGDNGAGADSEDYDVLITYKLTNVI